MDPVRRLRQVLILVGAVVVTIAMAVSGLTLIGYAGAVIVETISGGVVSGALAERRRQRTIDTLNDHFIICGYGRVGRRVAEEFRDAKVAYAVIDYREDAITAARRRVTVRAGTADELQRLEDLFARAG